MGSKFIILTILASAFAYGYALNCYLCYGSETSDCHDSDPSTKMTQYCHIQAQTNFWAPNVKNATDEYCVTAVLKANKIFSQGLVKGCGFIPKGLDICDYLINTGIALSCKACQTDLCNV